MNFEHSEKVLELRERVEAFMDEHVYPNEGTYAEQLAAADDRWTIPQIMDELKDEARSRGLWNLFMPDPEYGAGLTNLEYAPLCEVMGRSPIATRGLQLQRPRHGEHGGPGAIRDRPSRRSAGSGRCWRARSGPASP